MTQKMKKNKNKKAVLIKRQNEKYANLEKAAHLIRST